jgi:SAM-dependent methyltransferase
MKTLYLPSEALRPSPRGTQENLMGINGKDLQLLLHLQERGHVRRGSKIIEIGAQQLSNEFLRSESLVRSFRAQLGANLAYSMPAPTPVVIGPGDAELLKAEAPFARDFWISLGFDYTAIDVDGSPETIPLDLNFDSIPETLRKKFDLVTNFGTTEHICNQLNAFKAIHDLAAPGGVMIHHLPAGGSLNHGLFNYNMKFFWHLARSNEYNWLYANYYGSEYSYTVPDNIRDFVSIYEPEGISKTEGMKTSDYAILIAYQKHLDIPFVPPIDVNTGTKTDNANLNQRYWTVFKPELLSLVTSSGLSTERELAQLLNRRTD